MKYIPLLIPRCLLAHSTSGTGGSDSSKFIVRGVRGKTHLYFGPAKSSPTLAAHSQNGRDRTEDIISSRDSKELSKVGRTISPTMQRKTNLCIPGSIGRI
jgi:hypothetical protein